MIQRLTVNFRGQSALLMMAEDDNTRRLRDILEKLGFFVSRCDVLSEGPQTGSAIACAGLIIVDTDHLENPTVSLLAGSMAPIIALIGHESPSRLQRAMEVEPFSVMMKPVGTRGVFTSLFFAAAVAIGKPAFSPAAPRPYERAAAACHRLRNRVRWTRALEGLAWGSAGCARFSCTGGKREKSRKSHAPHGLAIRPASTARQRAYCCRVLDL